jgi:plasmid replication initiation protein
MAQKIVPKQDIVKSNALVEACYSPGSAWRMRIILACLMQVKSKDELSTEREFIVTANALADLTGKTAVNNYRELEKAATELMSMSIKIKNTPEGEKIQGWSKKLISILGECAYYTQQGHIKLKFYSGIIPYISSLKGSFTQYNAQYVMHMKSGYGIRLYELCMQWLGDEREFAIEDFKEIMGLENKYKSIKDLKKDVIFKALDDINTYSDIRVEFGQRKTGRIVTHLQFMIVKKRPEKVKLLPHREWIEKNQKARAGEDWPQAIKRTNTEYLKYKKTGE